MRVKRSDTLVMRLSVVEPGITPYEQALFIYSKLVRTIVPVFEDDLT